MAKQILPLKIKFSGGGEKEIEVHIDDEVAILICKNDVTFAKKLYKNELKQGNPNVLFDDKQNVMIERYSGRTWQEIAYKVGTELGSNK